MSIYEEKTGPTLPKQENRVEKEPQHFKILNEARFTPQSEINTSSIISGSSPDRPFDEMLDIIHHDPRLELALDTYVQMILGSGIKISARTKQLEKKIRDWFDDINFEQKLENGLYSYVGVGNLIFEKESKTNSDFIEVPIGTIKRIIRDKKGRVSKYVQEVNNKENELKPTDLIHLKFTDTARELFGRGIFHSVINDFTDPQTGVKYQAPIFGMKDMEDGLLKIIQNYASPIQMFHFKDAGPNFIEKQGDALKKARPGAKILTDKEFDVKTFEAKGDSKFDKYIEHLQRDIIEPGSQFPLQFFNAGFTARAASESTDSVLIRKVKRIQKRLANQIKEMCVMPYLKKINRRVSKDDFEIKFEFDDKTDFDINHLVTLFRDNGIKRSELRKNLQKFTTIEIDPDDMKDELPITSVTPTNQMGDEPEDEPEQLPQRTKIDIESYKKGKKKKTKEQQIKEKKLAILDKMMERLD